MLFVIAYIVIEIGAFVAMTHFLGFGWAVLITVGAVAAGLLLLRQQGRKVFAQLRRASRNEVDPRGPLTDTALLAGATILMVIPGVVSTAAGLLLLMPPVRRALRPAVAAVGVKSFAASMDRAGLYASGIYVRGGTVVDGTVVDSEATVSTPPTTDPDSRRLPRGH